MKLPNLKSILSGGIAESVTKISDLAHSWITTGKDKKEFEIEVEKMLNEQANKNAEIAQTELDSILKDVENARDSYTHIQESDKASWLAKNIMPLLTIVVTLGFFSLLIYMLKYEVPKSNERIMDILLGSLGTAWITMISFYFGSSKGSEDKSKIIHESLNKLN